MSSSLLCRRCGQPATHVHFIPWIEEPDRVELACAAHDPGDEWYTLAELAASPEGWMRALDRSRAPVPQELRRWLTARASDEDAQRPQEPKGVSSSHGLLNAEQVGEQVGLRPKTIRGRAAEGELRGLKVGGRWRFTQAAVDAWVASGNMPSGRTGGPRPRSNDTSPKQRPAGRTFRNMVGS